MRVRPLFRKLRHRAKITPVTIALEWELSIDWEFNPMLYTGMQIHFLKTFNLT